MLQESLSPHVARAAVPHRGTRRSGVLRRRNAKPRLRAEPRRPQCQLHWFPGDCGRGIGHDGANRSTGSPDVGGQRGGQLGVPRNHEQRHPRPRRTSGLFGILLAVRTGAGHVDASPPVVHGLLGLPGCSVREFHPVPFVFHHAPHTVHIRRHRQVRDLHPHRRQLHAVPASGTGPRTHVLEPPVSVHMGLLLLGHIRGSLPSRMEAKRPLLVGHVLGDGMVRSGVLAGGGPRGAGIRHEPHDPGRRGIHGGGAVLRTEQQPGPRRVASVCAGREHLSLVRHLLSCSTAAMNDLHASMELRLPVSCRFPSRHRSIVVGRQKMRRER